MKRRDFIKLPALIPGLKKILDDFTLPEVEEIVPEETPTTTFLEKSFKYPELVSSFSSTSPIPTWLSYPYDEHDINSDGSVSITFPEDCFISGGGFRVREDSSFGSIMHDRPEFSPPDGTGSWKIYVPCKSGIILTEVYRYG